MYQMNEQTSDLLDRVRGKLEVDLQIEGVTQDISDEEYADAPVYRLGEDTMSLLDQVRRKLEIDLHEMIMTGGTDAGERAAPGVGGAKNNPTDVADAFNLYLDNILDAVRLHSGKSESAARSFIKSMANKIASEGDLPPWPGEASDAEAAIWLGTAGTIGFHRRCVKAAGG